MSRRPSDTPLLALAILLSVALTALTVYSVAQQGRALAAREWGDLHAAAEAAAVERRAALRADLQRTFDAAAREWHTGGADALDGWFGGQPNWLLACASDAAPPPSFFPVPPLEQHLPEASGTATSAPDADRRDLNAALDYFRRLATSPDPLTRGGALIASAACEQQLGHPLGAARLLAEAAQSLRATPGLARFAFRADLSRVDSLLAAGDHERARAALTALLAGLQADHPARLSEQEVTRLVEHTQLLGLQADEYAAGALDELSRRAARRDQFAASLRAHWSDLWAPAASSSEEIRFHTWVTESGARALLAVRSIGPDAQLAVLAPLDDVVRRFWTGAGAGDDAAAWRVAEVAAAPPVLITLGPEFGERVLVPAPATRASLRTASHRRLAIVLATATGTAGAWALVLWMMARAIARQREFARLQRRFVADVSHELKTPLALIRLLSETLAGRRVTDPQRVQSYYETITRESERLTVLLDSILDLGRIESGRKQYEFGPCDVTQVAQRSWALFEPQFARDGFDAKLEIAPAVPPVRGDPQALQQVLVNLLQNAHRYSGPQRYVRLRITREGQLVLLTVEDRGIGMSRAQLQRIGDSFVRGDDPRVRETRGAGLGLAIVNHIVTAHLGKLEVHSRPNEGSRFTVWLPVTPAADGAPTGT